MNLIFLSVLFSFFSLLPFSISYGFHLHPLMKLSQSSKGSNSDKKSSHGYETKYFTQKLDHFSYQQNSYITFQQRYLINGDYWGGANKSSPIFVYIGNQGYIENFTDNSGFIFDIAPNFDALIVFIEHRYYGKSYPFGSEDEAFNNSNTAGYLSTTQALADFATLIVSLKKNLTAESSPVVVFGGFYGGMLAAWFRLKYPHLAIGALASSAPILQIDPKFDPFIFNNIITKDFKSASENCYKVIKNSWAKIDLALNHNTIEYEKMENSLRLCKGQGPYAKYWLITAFVYAAMADYPTQSNILQPLPANPVKEMCKAIDNPKAGNNTYTKLYGAMNIYYNFTGTEGQCFNITAAYDDQVGERAWMWQACTELFFPTYGNNKESIFQEDLVDSHSFMNYCVLNGHMNSGYYWLSTEFGARDIKKALKRFGSNIIFFNGLKDPWSGAGILKSISKTLIAIVAPEGAHRVDLRGSTKEDPKWLQDVRIREVQIIKQWIREYHEDFSI